MKKIISFLKNKYTIIVIIIIAIISISTSLIVKNNSTPKKEKTHSISTIDNVYPEEVQKLYSNTINVSCYGDLHFDIDIESGEVPVDKLNKNNVIDYILSNIEKNYNLNEKMTKEEIEEIINNIIYTDIEYSKHIKNYKYGEKIYNITFGKLTSKKGKCKSDIKYISKLYGYSYGTEVLSIDVNIGYLKNNILYDVTGKELGQYDGKAQEKLETLFQSVPYYKYNFVKEENNYKLKSVQLNKRYTINGE